MKGALAMEVAAKAYTATAGALYNAKDNSMTVRIKTSRELEGSGLRW